MYKLRVPAAIDGMHVRVRVAASQRASLRLPVRMRSAVPGPQLALAGVQLHVEEAVGVASSRIFRDFCLAIGEEAGLIALVGAHVDTTAKVPGGTWPATAARRYRTTGGRELSDEELDSLVEILWGCPGVRAALLRARVAEVVSVGFADDSAAPLRAVFGEAFLLAASDAIEGSLAGQNTEDEIERIHEWATSAEARVDWSVCAARLRYRLRSPRGTACVRQDGDAQ